MTGMCVIDEGVSGLVSPQCGVCVCVCKPGSAESFYSWLRDSIYDTAFSLIFQFSSFFLLL